MDKIGEPLQICRSKPENVREFKLTDKKNETVEGYLSNICEELTTCIAPVYAKSALESFKNMALIDNVTTDCRIRAPGNQFFSGFTCVRDFCAHAHKDTNKVLGGATAVVTVLRKEDRDMDQMEDQQFTCASSVCS